MAYLTEKTCFYHMPRTGGTFVLQALRHALGREGVVVNDAHDTPAEGRVDPAGRLTCTIVRNPFHWMRSWYQWNVEHQWVGMLGPSTKLMFCRDGSTFDGFARTYLRFMPGTVSQLYQEYTNGCQRVGVTERAAEDLCRFLQEAGESFDPLAILTYPNANTSSGKVAQTMLWPLDLAAEFAKVEAVAFDIHRTATGK